MLLAGDIGGTKTALGVFSEEQGPHMAVAESEVHSADYGSLESIAKEFPCEHWAEGRPGVLRRRRSGACGARKDYKPALDR